MELVLEGGHMHVYLTLLIVSKYMRQAGKNGKWWKIKWRVLYSLAVKNCNKSREAVLEYKYKPINLSIPGKFQLQIIIVLNNSNKPNYITGPLTRFVLLFPKMLKIPPTSRFRVSQRRFIFRSAIRDSNHSGGRAGG